MQEQPGPGWGEDDHLAQIAEISKNARTSWFGLIFILLFCGVALLDVQDRDFFEYGAATQLPLLGVNVPVVGFFVTAPLLLLGLYIYLHIYLAKLWLELGKAPAQPKGIDLDRAVFPWLIADAALRLRDDVPKRAFGWLTWLASLCLGWLFGPVIIGAFWVRSWPYHHEILTLYLGALLLVALWVGWDSWTARRQMVQGHALRSARYRWPVGLTLGAVLTVMGWEATEGGWLSRLPEPVKKRVESYYAAWFLPKGSQASFTIDDMTFLYPAKLAGANLVEMPPGWMGRDRALREYRRKHGAAHKREADENPDIPPLEEEFEEQRREQRAALNAKSFARADLRKADLAGAFLAGADLRRARLEGASLWQARLEGANLFWARLEGADLRWARLEGANLLLARLEGANLREASFKSTTLQFITNDFSDSSFADFTGAEGMTQAMVDRMFGNAATILPKGLKKPAHWPREESDWIEPHARYCAWLKSEGQTSRFCNSYQRLQ